MNTGMQILIGSVIGFIFAFFSMAASVNQKEKEVGLVWNNLCETLNERYRTLRKILLLMSEYMENSKEEISSLSEFCSLAIDEMMELKQFQKRLDNENKINDRLENLKNASEKYLALFDDPKYNELIDEVTEKETLTGEAIVAYNASVLEFKVLLETFPYSLICWILNKNADNYGTFNVMNIEEFGDDYVNEDEV